VSPERPSTTGASAPERAGAPSVPSDGTDTRHGQAVPAAAPNAAGTAVTEAGGLRARIGRVRRRDLLDAAAVVVPVVAFVVAGHLYSNQLLLLNMLLYAALAQGINLIYGFTGYLPFGYVAFFGTGAYGASLSVLYLHAPGVVAVLLGGLAGALLGGLLTPLLRLSGAYFAIASLAAAEAVYQVISNPSLTSITKGPYGINLVSIYNAATSYDTAIALLGLSMLGVVLLRRGRFGLALRASATDPVAAEMSGVWVVRERSVAWVVSAALAGFAGAIYAWAISVFYPSDVFDLTISVFAIVFALFGGVGTVWGPLLGTVVLYGIYNAVGLSDPQYFQLVYGLLIVALVLFLPGGLGSIATRLRSRRGALPTPTAAPATEATP
jgi:branched-chain amino acid transport system permease protein